MTYFKTTRKEKKVKAPDTKLYVCCHLCTYVGGTLKRERDLKGKKLKTKDGRALYYHVPCKVTAILHDFQDMQKSKEAENQKISITI